MLLQLRGAVEAEVERVNKQPVEEQLVVVELDEGTVDGVSVAEELGDEENESLVE